MSICQPSTFQHFSTSSFLQRSELFLMFIWLAAGIVKAGWPITAVSCPGACIATGGGPPLFRSTQQVSACCRTPYPPASNSHTCSPTAACQGLCPTAHSPHCEHPGGCAATDLYLIGHCATYTFWWRICHLHSRL